jgi:RimK-like ATP-grasp domain
MRIVFDAYNNCSKGLNRLVDSLRAAGTTVIKLKKVNSKYKHHEGDVRINWGTNKLAKGKLGQLAAFVGHGIPVPPYIVTKQYAKESCANGEIIVCRTLLNSKAGKGIVIARKPEEVVDAPLYTIYIKKDREFRVQVCGTSVNILEKKRKAGVEIKEKLIRTHENGYVFCSYDADAEPELTEALSKFALDAAKVIVTGDILVAGVDIIKRKGSSALYVLEVNAAPGIEGSSVEFFKQSILEQV